MIHDSTVNRCNHPTDCGDENRSGGHLMAALQNQLTLELQRYWGTIMRHIFLNIENGMEAREKQWGL
jgi:hypothetical protein